MPKSCGRTRQSHIHAEYKTRANMDINSIYAKQCEGADADVAEAIKRARETLIEN